jgi:hypothetical protein
MLAVIGCHSFGVHPALLRPLRVTFWRNDSVAAGCVSRAWWRGARIR